eukprot:12289515-Alexandrium_andersonii.AAC.1
MSASLVGSEMCIRDRDHRGRKAGCPSCQAAAGSSAAPCQRAFGSFFFLTTNLSFCPAKKAQHRAHKRM